MTDSEKRRRELLEHTRELYSDKYDVPPVHPRYGMRYSQYYEDGSGVVPGGSFGLRVFVCILLFAAFVVMDRNETEVMHVDSDRIVNEISHDLDVAEVWKSL